LVFSFDTGAAPPIDPEGWYVDDIVIENIAELGPDISGYKWNDQDGDGGWDASEPGLNGWTIYLDLDGDGQFDEGVEPSTITANDGEHDGAYQFDDLSAGTYTVREVIQGGWKQTFPAAPVTLDCKHEVTIDPSAGLRVNGVFGQATGPNFGNV